MSEVTRAGCTDGARHESHEQGVQQADVFAEETLLVVTTLEPGRIRFTRLQRLILGISQRMLTLTLRNLERDGLVSREVFAEVPPRVEYELSTMGRSLIGPAITLADWAIANLPAIEASRDSHDSAK